MDHHPHSSPIKKGRMDKRIFKEDRRKETGLKKVVIISAVRTPIGRYMGALKGSEKSETHAPNPGRMNDGAL